ncbi:origin recognition complex subunit 2-domain-containing protein [Chaetomium fimeti]|uniref:Origin recognition complex subunit 2 n=1 Tax=Chaetomium fimeti TaxID=1854472 RepID=A0AAE0LVZ0_9PEZI|nr:origin recognition complex subunit 2-domain-containing protein [Chaetomium fimeti]
MPRRKTTTEAPAPPVSRKRDLPADPYEVPDEAETPRRRRRLENNDAVDKEGVGEEIVSVEEVKSAVEVTPAKRRGRPPKSAVTGTPKAQATTPSNRRSRTLAETPVKLNGINTPSRRNIADRSARRKSARALIDRVIGGTVSDDEVEEGDIAREIYESSEDEEAEAEEQAGIEEGQEPATPSKAPGRKRRATGRKKSPTPPRDLPPHEQYFYQNKPGLAKTSNNTLSSLDLLKHDEYFSVLRQLEDPHAADVNFLQSLHAESFPQWAFELSQGFSTCLYGYGSKRRLLHNFATYLSSQNPSHKIVIINGYVRTLTARDILTTLTSALPSLAPGGGGGTGNPSTTLQTLLTNLTNTPAPDADGSPTTLTILVNSIDSPSLRSKPALQSLLAQLASHARVRLACTADTADFSLLWDAALRASLNLVFHDCTTFAPRAPCELDVVDEVHELLGRKARRAGGKEGVAFVLRSLPENARALFRLLVGEVLVAAEEQGGGAGAGGAGGGGEGEVAVEYRMVYNKAVEEFICSSEMAFRTLLKE